FQASNNYYIENRGEVNPQFVFYVVDNKSPNIISPVMVIDDEWGIDSNDEGAVFTILSSKYDSVRYQAFDGVFPPGYPRIYATGFDAIMEDKCSPVYQSSSPENTMQSSITVFSPITTVDYGSGGKHNVHVNWNAGYVGCSYILDQSYSSS
ncbi:hypothetical protein PFISCL1PPCAC_22528, partial [Pristionchus fissidentatus]